MFKPSKESGDYLNQIRNNIEEKTSVIEHAIETSSLPKDKEGRIKIIELGTGGGESLRRLKDDIKATEDVDLVAVDVLPGLLDSLHKELGVAAVPGDAAALLFRSESVSAVNASAILHEVSSYGTRDRTGEMIYGREAVRQAFSELNRILLPGGVVAYRDVLAPSENLQNQKKTYYNRDSWKLFAEWFLDDFVRSKPEFYKEAYFKSEDAEAGFSLDAPIGLQREFQRHYLMLRDYLRRGKGFGIGVEMLRSEWIDQSRGLKSITFSFDSRLLPTVDLSSFEVHKSAEGDIYKGDSDQFDKFYDDLMEYFFLEFKNGNAGSNNFKKAIDDWKEREGLEYYLYGNVADVLELSVEASAEDANGHTLLPGSASDIVIVSRDYYNRYLSQVADKPEKDGKQIIAFKKMPNANALESLNELGASDLRGGVLSEARLDELRRKIPHDIQ